MMAPQRTPSTPRAAHKPPRTPRAAHLTPPPELLDELETAGYLRMSVAFLRSDRSRGHIGGATAGPPFLRLGRTIRYRRDDLDAWLAEHRIDRKPRSPNRTAQPAA
jgi:hypothetical protein